MFLRRTVLAIAVMATSAADAQRAATRRIPQFENDDVRVWKSIIAPRQPLAMHRHDRGRTIVALVGGTLRVIEESGGTRTVTWESGRAYWLPADPPGTRHADVNEGNHSIEVIVVEMKR